MTFWNRKETAAAAARVWEIASAGRGTLRCVLHPGEGARVTLVVTSDTSHVATCTHQTRRDAIAHAGFLLDRFTANGWQIRSGMSEACLVRRDEATAAVGGEVASPLSMET